MPVLEPMRASDARGLGDLARSDAPRAGLDVLWPAVHHRADAVQVGQPPPLAHIVGVGDLAAGDRTLAADFTSLRHFRNPPRGPHHGVELNTTGGPVLQVQGLTCSLIFKQSVRTECRRSSAMDVEFRRSMGVNESEFLHSCVANSTCFLTIRGEV